MTGVQTCALPIYEAAILNKLNHKNIVKIADFIEEPEGLHLVMEFIEGRTLDKIIGKEVGPIPYEKALPLFNQILEGINYAHKQGVIHRDLKPSNIIVTPNNEIKITDFGIARMEGQGLHTKTGTKMGTLFYMSPEQIQGEYVNEQADIYSLGITLYVMLAGKLPFENTETMSDFAVMNKIINEPIKDPRDYYPAIPEWLVDIVYKAIEKDKTKRIKTIDELKNYLEKREISFDDKIKDDYLFFRDSFAYRKSNISKDFKESYLILKEKFLSGFEFINNIKNNKYQGFWISSSKNAHLYLEDRFLAYIKVSESGISLYKKQQGTLNKRITNKNEVVFDYVLPNILNKKKYDCVNYFFSSAYINNSATSEFFDEFMKAIAKEILIPSKTKPSYKPSPAPKFKETIVENKLNIVNSFDESKTDYSENNATKSNFFDSFNKYKKTIIITITVYMLINMIGVYYYDWDFIYKLPLYILAILFLIGFIADRKSVV